MGSETLSVAQKAYLVTWFSNDELNLVFGFIASSALLVNFEFNLIKILK